MFAALRAPSSAAASGHDHVVDAGRAAAQLRLRQVDQLQLRDRCAAPRAAAPAPAGRARGGRRRGRRPGRGSGAAARGGSPLGEHLVHVAHPRAERGGALGPLRVVGEQVAVLLHRRAAAGHVGDDVVDVEALERRRSSRRARASAGSSRPACSSSAPQHCWSRGTSTSQPSAASTRTVAALTRWKNTSCTQPVSSATRPRRVADRGGVHGQPGERLAHRHRRQQRLQRRQPARAASRRASAIAGDPAQLLVERPGHGGGPQPPLVREQREDRLAEQPVGRLARHVALDLRAHRLQQPVVLHARRARGHARHAAQAAVDVLGERPVAGRSRPSRRGSSGRSGRAGSPSPRPTAGRSGRWAGRTRSARSRRAARAAGGRWSSKRSDRSAGGWSRRSRRVCSCSIQGSKRPGPRRPSRVELGLDGAQHGRPPTAAGPRRAGRRRPGGRAARRCRPRRARARARRRPRPGRARDGGDAGAQPGGDRAPAARRARAGSREGRTPIRSTAPPAPRVSARAAAHGSPSPRRTAPRRLAASGTSARTGVATAPSARVGRASATGGAHGGPTRASAARVGGALERGSAACPSALIHSRAAGSCGPPSTVAASSGGLGAARRRSARCRVAFGHRVQPQHHLGEHGERAVGAVQQLGQVVAGHVLDHVAAAAGHRAVGQHQRHADHQVAQRAVHQRARARRRRWRAGRRRWRPSATRAASSATCCPCGASSSCSVAQRRAGAHRHRHVAGVVRDHAGQRRWCRARRRPAPSAPAQSAAVPAPAIRERAGGVEDGVAAATRRGRCGRDGR